jgi:hypothetical protein
MASEKAMLRVAHAMIAASAIAVLLAVSCTARGAEPPPKVKGDAPPKVKNITSVKGCECELGSPCTCPPNECQCPACSPEKQAQTLAKYVVRVSVGNSWGNGVWVWTDGKESICLTCNHIGGGQSPIKIRWGGKWYTGTIVKTDPRADLTAVRVAVHAPPATLGESVRDGDDLLMIGAASLWSTGKLVTTRVLNDGNHCVANYDSESGDSGGPVFSRGKLVGIHWGRNPGQTEQRCFTAPDTTREFLKGAVAVKTTAPGVAARPFPLTPSPTPTIGAPIPNADTSLLKVKGHGFNAAPAPFAAPTYTLVPSAGNRGFTRPQCTTSG